jgi:hypothetical protein
VTAPNRPSARHLRSGIVLAGAAAGLLILAAAWPGSEVGAMGARSLAAPPPTLSQAGLYSDIRSKTVAPENLPYSPQYPLYTDGAVKKRWLYLPPGQQIDASDLDHWVFPPGTRIYKEFAFGRRIETRLMERREDGWLYAAYVWNAEESEATLAPERGLAGIVVGNGLRHDIPGRYDCLACHQGQPNEVLGFGALQLSPRRDPGALHAEALPAGAVDLESLALRGLIRGLPEGVGAPEIAGPPRQRAALGYLHANCGHCHNALSPLRGLELDLSFPLLRSGDGAAPAIATTLGVKSLKKPQSAPAEHRVVPGAPERSSLIERLSSQDPNAIMPTLGNRLIDERAVALLEAFIREDLTAPLAGPADAKTQ